MNTFTAIVGTFCAALGATIAHIVWYKRRSCLPLPPSPKGYPVIGHLLVTPSKDEHLEYIEIARQLDSDIFHLNVLGTDIVVLNSLVHATNLLEKRSAIYSDRASPPMVAEPALMNWGSFVGLEGYNDRWKTHRRLMHQWLNKKAIQPVFLAQQHATRSLLQRLCLLPEDWSDSEKLYEELHIAIACTLTDSIYGHKIKSLDDVFYVEAKEVTENFMKAVMPSNFLVNILPFMVHIPEWLPGAGWKRLGRLWGEQKDRLVNTAYAQSKARIGIEEDRGSLVGSLLKHIESLGLESSEADEYVKEIAYTLVGAGTDTTSATMLVFISAMVKFPEVQQRAQQEIDAVVDSDRLPTMEDQASLSYIDRLIEEVLRWHPVAPLGVPHVCYQDDKYQGFRIPKGTVVISNIWAMNHDQSVYQRPEVFDPDRYLDSSIPLPSSFGFGRRSCPGSHFAKASLFIAIASLLALFDIVRPEDYLEAEVASNQEETSKLVYRPKPFKLKLIIRSSARLSLIHPEALG